MSCPISAARHFRAWRRRPTLQPVSRRAWQLRFPGRVGRDSEAVRLGGPFRPGGLLSPQNPLRLGGALRSGQNANGVRIGASIVWLLFIVFPLVDAVSSKHTSLPKGVIIAAATLFIAGYLSLVFTWRWHQGGPWPLVLFGLLIAVATFLTVGQKSGWGFLFTYCAACAAIITPDRLVAPAVAFCVVMAGSTSAIGGASGGNTIGAIASTAGVGLLMLLLRDLRMRNSELLEARAELARLAVAQERERFARDLHDLLGHSLSVIALKAELAGRLLDNRQPHAAAGEIGDLEKVARGALSEVRDAVSGYRKPTLDVELEGARVALSAAGIDTEVERDPAALDPQAEAVFAWAVREGATNVIRHSGARRCTVAIGTGVDAAWLEMIDDGSGVRGSNGGGHGLAGLAERVGALHGRLESGAAPGGGFRLAIKVPVAAP
jgi:two-component system, NarL family, sensor histidine kinase DesK